MRRLIHRGPAASAVIAAALMAMMLPGGLAQAATSVGLATVELGSQSAQATQVTYTIGFTATSGLAAGGKVTLTGLTVANLISSRDFSWATPPTCLVLSTSMAPMPFGSGS